MTDRRTPMILLAMLVLGCGEEPALEESHAEGPADIVSLDSLQLIAAGIEYAVVAPLSPDTLHLTGSVTYDAARVSHVGPRMQGRIRRVPVEIGSPIDVDDTLAVLDSPELGAAQAAWFTASVEREVSKRNYDRAERLYRDGIVSERRRLEAEGTFRQAEGQLVAAERALAALGAQPDSAASSVFVLRSPLAGIVVDKHATTGEVVASDAQLFTVADLSRLWIILDVYETDLSRVFANSPVVLTTQAYPNRLFHGHVAYVGAIVDTTSRTVKVRVELPNADLTLKPGMFARADLVLTDSTPPIGVPQDAIQTLEGRTVVFVQDGPSRFRATDVVVGPTRAGGWVEILNGLARGDTIVAEGSFSLKADLLKASFGEEGH